MNLKIHSLSKKYNGKTALEKVSFEVEAGETVGILGPNGAGKTTLFYMIAGLIKSDNGNIFLNSLNLNGKSISERTTLGLNYLPQESSIFRNLTVEQNILSSLEHRKDLQKRQRQENLMILLEDFNLKKVRKTLGIKLSGGERRRTELARALALNPKFILLDEPFAGIDPIAVADLKNTILTLNKKNIGVLISDHNVRDTMNICSEVFIVSEGRIIADGNPSEVAKDSTVKDVYLGKNFKIEP